MLQCQYICKNRDNSKITIYLACWQNNPFKYGFSGYFANIGYPAVKIDYMRKGKKYAKLGPYEKNCIIVVKT